MDGQHQKAGAVFWGGYHDTTFKEIVPKSGLM